MKLPKWIPPAESLIWTLSLVALAVFNPATSTGSFSLCLIDQMGFDFCPGCGLGHSIAWLFKGDILASFEAHFLGPFAVIVLITRIFKLNYQHYFATIKITNHA